MDAFTEGAASMVPALMILTLAWTISGVIADVGTAQFLVGTLSSRLPAFAVAPLVLLVASLVSFATGTSWGTMAIVMPLAIPLAYNVSPSILTLVVGSVLVEPFSESIQQSYGIEPTHGKLAGQDCHQRPGKIQT